MSKLIVDVSEHQGVIDWKKLSKSVDAVIIRCGYGKNVKTQDDKQWLNNVKGAIKYKVPFGVYIYSYAKDATAARSEAKHVIRLLKPYKKKIALPVFYDLEQSGTEKFAKTTAKAFKKAIEAAGYECVFYANEYWWKHYLVGLLSESNKERWVAKYGVNNGKQNRKPDVPYFLWQYSSRGKVPGIAGNVDVNIPTNAFIKAYLIVKGEEIVSEPDYAIVTAVSGLSCRAEKSTTSTLLGVFTKLTKLEILEGRVSKDEWVKVKGKDVKGEITIGYCYTKYLEEV